MTGLSQPELHVIAGPNGAGKSTFYEYILAPGGVEFINAEQRRSELLAERRSFGSMPT